MVNEDSFNILAPNVDFQLLRRDEGRIRLKSKGNLYRSVAQLISIVKMVKGVVNGWPISRHRIMFARLFVLETIRASAMRVIHVIVKTEETQKFRMNFVLHHYVNFELKKIYHSICQQVDTSGSRSTSPLLDSRHEDCSA